MMKVASWVWSSAGYGDQSKHWFRKRRQHFDAHPEEGVAPRLLKEMNEDGSSDVMTPCSKERAYHGFETVVATAARAAPGSQTPGHPRRTPTLLREALPPASPVPCHPGRTP